MSNATNSQNPCTSWHSFGRRRAAVEHLKFKFQFTSDRCLGTWEVNEWGSDPAEGADDHFCGSDFSTLEEAVAYFESYSEDAPWIELTGPGVYRKRANPNHDAERQERADAAYERSCRQEMAMELGMGLGVDAYNDAMGY